MPTAICDRCGKSMSWRNQRGNRLSDYRCPACDGRFVAAMWDPQTQSYVKRSSKRRSPQGPIVCCVLCGRRGRRFGPKFRGSLAGYQVGDYARARYGAEKIAALKPDDPVCFWHLERAANAGD